MSATRWGRDWRKIYCRPSHDWLQQSMAVRGLGYEMIRVAAEDGTISVGQDAAAGLSNLVCVPPTERRLIRGNLQRLVEIQFCAIHGAVIHIRNFVAAQTTVADSTARVREHRARKQDAAEGGHGDLPASTPAQPDVYSAAARVNSASTRGQLPVFSASTPRLLCANSLATPREDSGASVSETFHATADKTRQEERRREETRPEEKRESTVPAGAGPSPTVASVLPFRSPDRKEPLPFTVVQLLAELHRTAPARFPEVQPRDVAPGHAIAIQKMIRAYPTLGEWTTLGMFVAAGGVIWPPDLGIRWVASDGVREAMSKARAWETSGRAPVLQTRSGRTFGEAAPVAERFELAPGENPLADLVEPRRIAGGEGTEVGSNGGGK